MKLVTHLHLLPWLEMCVMILPPPIRLMAWCVVKHKGVYFYALGIFNVSYQVSTGHSFILQILEIPYNSGCLATILLYSTWRLLRLDESRLSLENLATIQLRIFCVPVNLHFMEI